jgi:hypothetical protein
MAKKQTIRVGRESWFKLRHGTDAEEVVRKTLKHLRGVPNVQGVIIEEAIRIVTVVSARGHSAFHSKIHNAEINIMNEFSLRPIDFDFSIVRETPDVWERHRNGRHAIIRFNRRPAQSRRARAK